MPPGVDPEEHDDSAWSSDARSDSGASDDDYEHQHPGGGEAAAASSDSDGGTDAPGHPDLHARHA